MRIMQTRIFTKGHGQGGIYLPNVGIMYGVDDNRGFFVGFGF